MMREKRQAATCHLCHLVRLCASITHSQEASAALSLPALAALGHPEMPPLSCRGSWGAVVPRVIWKQGDTTSCTG